MSTEFVTKLREFHRSIKKSGGKVFAPIEFDCANLDGGELPLSKSAFLIDDSKNSSLIELKRLLKVSSDKTSDFLYISKSAAVFIEVSDINSQHKLLEQKLEEFNSCTKKLKKELKLTPEGQIREEFLKKLNASIRAFQEYSLRFDLNKVHGFKDYGYSFIIVPCLEPENMRAWEQVEQIFKDFFISKKQDFHADIVPPLLLQRYLDEKMNGKAG